MPNIIKLYVWVKLVRNTFFKKNHSMFSSYKFFTWKLFYESERFIINNFTIFNVGVGDIHYVYNHDSLDKIIYICFHVQGYVILLHQHNYRLHQHNYRLHSPYDFNLHLDQVNINLVCTTRILQNVAQGYAVKLYNMIITA